VDHTLFFKSQSALNGNGNGNGAGAGRYSCIEFLCAVMNEVEGAERYRPQGIGADNSLNDMQCRSFEREIKGGSHGLIYVM